MEKLLGRKRMLLAVAISSLSLGILSIAGIIFFILKLWYLPMALCIALTAHAFYGCPFYFIAYANAQISEKILREIEGGESDLAVIADRAGVKPDFAEKLIEKSRKRGEL